MVTNAPHTLQCHCCDQRKIRTGFRLLAGRHISICPSCWPSVLPYIENLDEFRARLDEQAARFVISLLRRSANLGCTPPAPEKVAAHLEVLTPFGEEPSNAAL